MELIILFNNIKTDYHYFLGKYYSVTLYGSSSIEIKFNSINIYNTCKETIFQNYNRNPSVEKKEVNNGTIEYRFKFRWDKVCITLYDGSQDTDICVDGNEELTWWKLFEASGIFVNQYEVNNFLNFYKALDNSDKSMFSKNLIIIMYIMS